MVGNNCRRAARAIGARREEEEEEKRRRGQGARNNSDAMPDGLLARFGAEHVTGLDVGEQIPGVRGDFRRHSGGDEIRGGIGAIDRADGELRDLC